MCQGRVKEGTQTYLEKQQSRKELSLARQEATVKWTKIRIKDLFSKWGNRKLTQAATETEEKWLNKSKKGTIKMIT